MITHTLTPALNALNLTEDDLTKHIQAAAPRIAALKARIVGGELPAFGSALQLPAATAQAVAGWGTKFQHVLILGLGGSSLGGRLVNTFADPAHLQNPRLHFLDHLCPVALNQFITQLPLAQTALVIISKSGSTLETTTQLAMLEDAFTEAGLTMAGRTVTVTEPTANPLRQWAESKGIPVLPHNPALGGRYSFFGETGTIPALIKGVDVAALHHGAQTVLNDWLQNPLTSAPAMGAALQAAAASKGKPITVLYAYGEPYRTLPAWFEQLWAESLGKSGHGTTPLGASGPASQHSIQQLFLDGPADKLFTVVIPQTHRQGPARSEDGVTAGTLQLAMAQGTVAALAARNHPARTIEIEANNPTHLGALLMHFMLETVLTAQLWALDPFNQPAVEESKKASLAALAQLAGA